MLSYVNIVWSLCQITFHLTVGLELYQSLLVPAEINKCSQHSNVPCADLIRQSCVGGLFGSLWFKVKSVNIVQVILTDRKTNSYLLSLSVPSLSSLSRSIADLGFNSHNALITHFLWYVNISQNFGEHMLPFSIQFRPRVSILNIPDEDLLWDLYWPIVPVRLCATILLDSRDSKNKCSLIPPLRNSQCSQENGIKIKIIWYFFERVLGKFKGHANQKNPWKLHKRRVLSCPATRPEQWKGIPG